MIVQKVPDQISLNVQKSRNTTAGGGGSGSFKITRQGICIGTGTGWEVPLPSALVVFVSLLWHSSSMPSFLVKKLLLNCFIDLRWAKGCLVSELTNEERQKLKQ